MSLEAEKTGGAPVSAGLPERKKVSRVVSAKTSVPQRVVEIWRSRELLGHLISSSIKVKYKNSALGLVWSMVNPAMTLLIYWFVFGVVLHNAIPNFVIYLFSGLLFFNFFQTGVQMATGTIVDNAGLVKKVAFPREILCLAAVGTSAVFLFFQAIVMVLFLAVLQYAPDWGLLWMLIPVFLGTALFSSALGIALGAINVYLRDMKHLIDVVLTAWFWGTPIVYSFAATIYPHLVRHGLTWVYMLNPMNPIVLTTQRVIYAHPIVHLTSAGAPIMQLLPNWGWSTYLWMDFGVIGASLVLVWIALAIFGRLEGNFAETL